MLDDFIAFLSCYQTVQQDNTTFVDEAALLIFCADHIEISEVVIFLDSLTVIKHLFAQSVIAFTGTCRLSMNRKTAGSLSAAEWPRGNWFVQ